MAENDFKVTFEYCKSVQEKTVLVSEGHSVAWECSTECVVKPFI